MLSILIPTHNRPALFERCLRSILSQHPTDVEIIVNNDSNDIVEFVDPRVKYFYNKFENLSLIYKFLLEQASGEYVYFLEDDDYLADNFFSIPLTSDLVVGNYFPVFNSDFLIKCSTKYKNDVLSKEQFIKNIDLDVLQLSQHIFRKQCLTDFVFPMDNNIYNDANLVLHAASNASTVTTTGKVLFFQTADGKDNLSFPESSSLVNISRSLKFLENYELYTATSSTTRP